MRLMDTRDQKERLQKVLARAGVASRRESEKLILTGHIMVNGKVVRELGTKVDPEVDEIRVDTELLKTPGRPLTYLVNKPRGYLSTTKDEHGRKTVLDLLPPTSRRMYPAGRLDEDSEGLIIITDDGSLTNLITHPRFGIPKTYDLRIRGRLEGAEVKRVESGVWLAEGRTGPARIRIRKRGRHVSHVEVTLTEGRNRELRRIFARIGHPVLSLRRIRVGPLSIRGLRIGQYRRLKAKEFYDLKGMAK